MQIGCSWWLFVRKQFGNTVQVASLGLRHHCDNEEHAGRTECRIDPECTGRRDQLQITNQPIDQSSKYVDQQCICHALSAENTHILQIMIRFDDDEHDSQIEWARNGAEQTALCRWEDFAHQQEWNATETNGKTDHEDDKTGQWEKAIVVVDTTE